MSNKLALAVLIGISKKNYNDIAKEHGVSRAYISSILKENGDFLSRDWELKILKSIDRTDEEINITKNLLRRLDK